MFKRIIDFFSRGLHYIPAPENSFTFRLFTLITVEIGIFALAYTREWSNEFLFIIITTPFAYWISWKRRNKDNWWLKVLITIGMFCATLDYFYNLGNNLYDPRIPLATLILWLQLLHSFDLPGRKDLWYSLFVSFTLISIGGVLSRDTNFGFFIIIYFIFFSITLTYNYVVKFLSPIPGGLNGLLIRKGIGAGIMTIIVGALIAFFLPRQQHMFVRTLPIFLKLRIDYLFRNQIANPGYYNTTLIREVSSDQIFRHPWGEFNPDAYFGFTPILDLDYRGKLSSKTVLKVQSNYPCYYRGVVFDFFNGRNWLINNKKVEEYFATIPPIKLPTEPEGNSKEIIQIFYTEAPQPNIIFAAYKPYMVYFLASKIYLDANFSVRSPFLISEGTTYSVISYRQFFSAKQLRTAKAYYTSSEKYYFLQLPDVITSRVINLTHKITAPYSTPYDKVVAIINYLRTHYPYTLDVPCSSSKDYLDFFLFEAKRGYCEHFATALAIMCRLEGIASRLVTGYAIGSYNPFTGIYEIKAQDAHAWVEVLLPPYGWISFEPTPSFEFLDTTTASPQEKSFFENLKNYFNFKFSINALLYKNIIFSLLFIIIIIFGLYLYKINKFDFMFKLTSPDPYRQSIYKCFHKMCKLLPDRERLDYLTPKELKDLLINLYPPLAREITAITSLFEEAYYSQHKLTLKEVNVAKENLFALRQKLRSNVRSKQEVL